MGRSVLLLVLVLGFVGTAAPSSEAADDQVARQTLVIQQTDVDDFVPTIVDELAPETVLDVRAIGFEPDTTGSIRQCVHGRAVVCSNQISVRTDDEGRARFQYLVTDHFHERQEAEGRCRLAAAPCTIELRLGDDVGIAYVVFVDAAPPPGTVRVEPRAGIRVGETVDVALTGFPPGAELDVTVCALPAVRGSRCGPPAPTGSVVVGADGTAEISLGFETTRVGADGIRCGPRRACHVVVSSEEATVRARPVALAVAAGPGPRYDGWRVTLGLAGAVALLGAAAWLLVTTVWDPPRESDGSAIDEAELADLDREAAEFVDRTIRAGSG